MMYSTQAHTAFFIQDTGTHCFVQFFMFMLLYVYYILTQVTVANSKMSLSQCLQISNVPMNCSYDIRAQCHALVVTTPAYITTALAIIPILFTIKESAHNDGKENK